jgi:hypothetical protein
MVGSNDEDRSLAIALFSDHRVFNPRRKAKELRLARVVFTLGKPREGRALAW